MGDFEKGLEVFMLCTSTQLSLEKVELEMDQIAGIVITLKMKLLTVPRVI